MGAQTIRALILSHHSARKIFDARAQMNTIQTVSGL